MTRKTVPTIKITAKPKRRLPHKPTRAFRDRTKYYRKGRAAQRRKDELKDRGG